MFKIPRGSEGVDSGSKGVDSGSEGVWRGCVLCGEPLLVGKKVEDAPEDMSEVKQKHNQLQRGHESKYAKQLVLKRPNPPHPVKTFFKEKVSTPKY
eukprot:5821775-Pyramimonas_sp.AAC.1